MTVQRKIEVLLTGASGFLGFNLMSLFKAEFEVYGTYCANAPPIERGRLIRLDVTSAENVKEVLGGVEPEVVVHAAAKADVDFCERNRGISHEVNVIGSENLAKEAKLTGARVVFLSTDLVFDGEKRSYSESDNANPTSFYGSSKLEAEKRVLNILDEAVVLRLSLMYGDRGYGNVGFTYKLVESLQRGQAFKLFTDQYRTPLYLDDLAEALKKIIMNRNLRGLYHLGGPERVSRWEFGRILAEVFGFSKELLVPIRMEDLPRMIARPRDCSLNSSRLYERLELHPLTVREGLRKLKKMMPVNQQEHQN